MRLNEELEKAELTLIQRVFKTAIKNWGYGILANPGANIELPKFSKQEQEDFIQMNYLH